MTPLAFTHEQRAAIAARAGSSLLAAGAGSGKTAVMVERIAEAVRLDGVPVGAVLAVTFTEKAAGELRERLRHRLLELGEAEHARAVDGAWIGTIHGVCARVLRAQPLAAGLDPRAEVLDERTAARLAATAYERALEAWAAERGAAAVDLAAAYGSGLRDVVANTYAALRSRGATRPRLEIPAERAAPDPARVLAARVRAEAALAAAGEGARVRAGRAALAACAELLARALPWPGDLAAAELKRGARALDEADCEPYRDALAAHRRALADHHARAALILLDDLLDRFGAAYDAVKAERAGLDFDDLQLRARAVLSEPRTRRRWAERFALIMIDEFQDTNRLQLDILEALERDNLFAVGDELQSIYRFRHADVTLFRARRARLGEARTRGLHCNFRSAQELLDVVNATFAAELGARFEPLTAGRRGAPAAAGDALRLFDPDPLDGDPPVELLVTDSTAWEDRTDELGLGGGGDAAWRRAEARAVAHRLRAELDGGRRAGDVVVLVRATASLRLLEEALEEQGVPTYVVGGRGYWSQEQVRDGLAWLAVLANPHDEAALYTVLASPFCGASADALVMLAAAGRDGARGAWAALQETAADDGRLAGLPEDERTRLRAVARLLAEERRSAERLPVEVLLERALAATGYDLAVLARRGGDRRMANLRKLMRLAREYERAEGRDLRAFVAYAAAQDLAEAREGEAALESDGVEAVRLMTIHRAKGLEFPVVCVADLGRASGGRRGALLVGDDGTAGLRLAPLGGGDSVPTAAWERLADAEAAAEAEEERRLFYVAMTRAEDKLILSGGMDPARRAAPRPGRPPIEWIAPALLGADILADAAAAAPGAADATAPACVVARTWDGRDARVAVRLITPATLEPAALAARPRAGGGGPGTALPAVPATVPALRARPRPVPERLSYSALADYARCPYRYYLRRVLRLPRDPAPPPSSAAAPAAALDPLVRGTLVHRALEALDFARPAAPDGDAVRALGEAEGVTLSDDDVADIRALVGAFAASPLCARLAAAVSARREAAFAFAVEQDGAGPLVNGIVDVLAEEAGGGMLVVDYKSDRLDGAEPAELVERDYATQRVIYALAALRAGAERVEVAHCLLERPDEPVCATFTAADAPELAARVVAVARGLLAHEHPVAPSPHRELCGDCPGRRALCSWTEAMTLRDPEEARAQVSAGSLAGSGGPS